MGRLDFEKNDTILRFFELAMVSAVGPREALDVAKPCSSSYRVFAVLSGLSCECPTFWRASANWSAH